MKKISLMVITVLCLPSSIWAAERKEPSDNGKVEIQSTPMPSRANRNSHSNPQSPKTPTSSSGRNSPKLSKPLNALTSSDTPKTPKKTVKSLKDLQGELKNRQELSGSSGEVKK